MDYKKTNGIHTHLILGDIYLKNIIINVQDVDGEKRINIQILFH